MNSTAQLEEIQHVQQTEHACEFVTMQSQLTSHIILATCSHVHRHVTGMRAHKDIVVGHNIWQSILPIHLISQDDLILIVEGDIPLVLLVEDIRSFPGIPGLDRHIPKHLQDKSCIKSCHHSLLP